MVLPAALKRHQILATVAAFVASMSRLAEKTQAATGWYFVSEPCGAGSVEGLGLQQLC
jgi:hypothetical protein